MRAHIVENGVIVNTIEVESLDFSDGLVAATGNEGIGWRLEQGSFIPPAVVMPTNVDEYDLALMHHFNSVAQSDKWENRVSLIARAGYQNAWQAKAISFGTWMDQCNEQCLSMLGEFEVGNIPQPTIAEMIASLPPMVWPD